MVKSETQVVLINITKVTLEGLMTALPGAPHGMKKSKFTHKTPQ